MSTRNARRLFVVDFTGLGSGCLAVPVLRGMERADPGVRYTYPHNAVLDDPGLRAASGLHGLLDLVPARWRRFDVDDWADIAGAMERHRVDTVVNFRNPDRDADPRYPRFRAWCERHGPRVRWHDLYDVDGADRMHVQDRMIAVLAAAGVSVAPVTPSWLPGPDRPRRVVGLFAGASAPTKRWPVERWVELARELAPDGTRFTLLSGAGGGEWADTLDLAERLGGVVPADRLDVVPATGTSDLVARLGALSVLVANDTGVGHVAAACGTPVVSVFLSTIARVWRPRSETARALQSTTGARCPNQRPRQGNCTRHYDTCVAPCHLDLSAREVADAARDALAAEVRA